MQQKYARLQTKCTNLQLEMKELEVRARLESGKGSLKEEGHLRENFNGSNLEVERMQFEIKKLKDEH